VTVHLDVPDLAALAQQLPGDPACTDLGKLDAAAARTRAAHLGQDVYGSLWLKTAAPLETLARLRPLEQHNAMFAYLAAEAFLLSNGRRGTVAPLEAMALVTDSEQIRSEVAELATRLRSWAA
jgi:death-on-curing protein